MSNATEIVRAYCDAFSAKDMAALRKLLSDDFSFLGPMMAAEGGDSFVEQLQNFPPQARYRYEDSRMIVEGDNVAHMFDFVVSAPVEEKVRMCECFEVRDGKIHSSRLYFDTAQFPSP